MQFSSYIMCNLTGYAVVMKKLAFVRLSGHSSLPHLLCCETLAVCLYSYTSRALHLRQT